MRFLLLVFWSVMSGHVMAFYFNWATMSYQSDLKAPVTNRKDPFEKEADYVHKPERNRRTKWWQSKSHKYKQSAFHRTSLEQKEATRKFGQRILDPHEAKARLGEDWELLDGRKFRESEERRRSAENAKAREEQKMHPHGPKEVAQNAEQGLRTGLGKAVGVATKVKATFEQNGAKRRKLEPRPLKL